MVRSQRDNAQTEFTVTNHTEGLSLDCNSISSSLALADFIGTLVKELQAQGILRGTTTA